METKFLLSDDNANLWKFITIYKRYKKKQLNGDEYFNFVANISFLGKSAKTTLDELIMDRDFINDFIFNWDNRFYKFNK